MSISSTDLKLIASERMIDNLSPSLTLGGGGDLGRSFVVSGTENNLFPDVMPGDRVAGLVQYRKVFAAVMSADNGSLYNAQAGMDARPTDANVEMGILLSAFGDGSIDYTGGVDWAPIALGAQRRTGIPNGLASFEAIPHTGGISTPSCNITSGTNTISAVANVLADGIRVGDMLNVSSDGFVNVWPWRKVTAISGDTTTWAGATITVDGAPFPYSLSGLALMGYLREPLRPYHVSSLALTTAGVSAGATSVVVDKLDVGVVLPATSLVTGRQPLWFKNDRVLLQHPSVAATREYAIIDRVNWATGEITFTAALANAYPTGTKMSRPLDLGLLQARADAYVPFSQQTWNRQFGTTVVGTPPTGQYSGTIGLTNDGTDNDDWAAVFSSTTVFNLISRRRGQIGTGNIGTDYMPLNPLTGQPFFTLYAANWGGGWQPGNVFRFPTSAAARDVWAFRLTKPSTAGGTDQGALYIHGDIDA